MMERYQDHNRARNRAVNLRLSPEEYRNVEAKIKLSGLNKNEYMIRAMLNDPIYIRAGKFESDRLSVEIHRLAGALEKAEIPEDAVSLLLECRALVEQLARVTKREVIRNDPK